MVCYAYSLFCGEVCTEKSVLSLHLEERLSKSGIILRIFMKSCGLWYVYVQGAPENVVSGVFLDVPAGACRARCELDLKHVCI